APVATPSNSASTPRISGQVSSAATKCISDVPGLAKQTLTPASTRVWTSARAPFMRRFSQLARAAARRRSGLLVRRRAGEQALGHHAMHTFTDIDDLAHPAVSGD